MPVPPPAESHQHRRRRGQLGRATSTLSSISITASLEADDADNDTPLPPLAGPVASQTLLYEGADVQLQRETLFRKLGGNVDRLEQSTRVKIGTVRDTGLDAHFRQKRRTRQGR